MDKYIIHCDMNNYFASVEALDNPYLNEVPFVVTGDVNMHHGIILSKNNKAKSFGICTGESLFSCKKKCSEVVAVPANYKKYLHYAKLSRSIYLQYSSKVYPYGLDEAWIDVSDMVEKLDDAIDLARTIKKRIMNELGLIISVGISFNYVFSKLGSDMKLSNDVFVIDKSNYLEVTENIPAFQMLFIGSKTRSALKKMNILTIGDLRRADVRILKNRFGKTGQVYYDFANGNDSWFNPATESEREIKSLGNTITTTLNNDIINAKDCEDYIYVLVSILVKRLKKHKLQGRYMQLQLKFNDLSTNTKQKSSDIYISDQKRIYELAYSIYSKMDIEKPVRSICIRISKLIYCGGEQLSLFDNDDFCIDEVLIKTIERLKNKYGEIMIEKSNVSLDWED